MVTAQRPPASSAARPQPAGNFSSRGNPPARPLSESRRNISPEGPAIHPPAPAARTRAFRKPKPEGATFAGPPARPTEQAGRSSGQSTGGTHDGGDRYAARGSGRPATFKPKGEETILFQTFFKSVGPRTYAAQVKRAGNGNHALVLTEGKRDPDTGEVKKHKLYLWSEDFPAFFKMLQETVGWIKANPVPEEVKARRDRFWKREGRK